MRAVLSGWYIILLVGLFCNCGTQGQENKAVENADHILSKSINYHDPNDKWNSFQGILDIKLETPKQELRNSLITIDKPNDVYRSIVTRDNITYEQYLHGDSCVSLFEGSTNFSDSIATKYRLTCESAANYNRYYRYLYGLPMKLRDAGTIIYPDVEEIEFYGNNYLRIKVDYEKGVGSDTWYFYFDPGTYALKAYQFFHDESANDGEYILLEGEVKYQGMKIPKDRTWYYNTNNDLLGVDYLNSIKNL